MNYKKLDRLTALYQELRALDSVIIHLDKMCLSIINNECDCDMDFRVVDLASKRKTESEKVLDDDGSIANPMRGLGLLSYAWMTSPTVNPDKSHEYTTQYQCTLPSLVAIQVLGVMLGNKRELRELIIKEIKQLSI